MPNYYFKAKKGPQDVIEDTLVAENEQMVLAEISRRGYLPVTIELVKKKKALGKSRMFIRKKIKVNDLALFSRQLSDLLGAGLPLFRAINILLEQTESPVLKNVISQLRDDIKEGKSLSDSMRRQKKVFPPIYASMIKAGEMGGFLEKVLEDLAAFSEKDVEVRAKISSAMLYPSLVAIIGSGAVIFMMAYVVPMMMTMFEETGQQLPLITRILIAISDFFRNYWWVLIACFGMGAIFLKRVKKSGEGRFRMDRAKLTLPVMGELIRKSEISRFARTLGALLMNGVPMLPSLEVIQENISNTVLAAEVKRASEEIKRGGALGNVLRKSPYFPGAMTNMIAIGEESGHVEQSLIKIATAYDREIDEVIHKFTTLLEPLMILVIAGFVLFIIIAILLPIFQMNAMLG